ncbi:MAG: hypothetical protein KGL39_36880 [Patescibacteria group bacterium]|nr:hypothetical protein [Patescibacteria group bacterium]
MKPTASPVAERKLLTPENLAACLRQGCYVCGHCSRISRIGAYVETEDNGGRPQGPPCEHCKKRALTWHPPVLDDRQN